MKKLFFILLLLPFLSHAQTGNDTTKYTYYKFQYGNRAHRFWGDSVVEIPTDTINSKWGLARKDTIAYVGNGTKWTRIGGAGGGSSYAADESSIHLGGGNIFSIKPTWAGQTAITTVGNLSLGAIVSGFTPITDPFISSAGTWNAKLTSSLASAHLFVGNAGNVATDVAISGDVGINNTGATTLSSIITAGSCTACNLTYDAKGRITVAGNGTGAGGTPFPDNSTLIKNNADNTKLLILGAANITTATTRTIQSPDANGTIDLQNNTATLTNKSMSGAANTFTNISEPSFAFTNVTTANATISQHGLLPKLPNDSTLFLNGLGTYGIPTKFSLPRKLIGIGGFTTDLLSYSSSFFYDSASTYSLVAGGVAGTGASFEVGSSQNGGIWLVNGQGVMQSNTQTNFITLGYNGLGSPAATNSLNAGGGVGTGGQNTSLGVLAGGKGGTGNQTIQLGYRSGFFNNTVPTGSVTYTNDIFIGSFTGPDNTQTGPSITNSTYIGNNIGLDSNNVAIFGRKDQRIILGSNGVGGPGGNTAAMNAFAPMLGQIFFNTDSGAYCMWNNSIWVKWGSGSGGGGGGFVDPLTTNGDLMARIFGVTTRLPKGSNNNVLLTDGSGNVGYNLLTNSNLSGSAAISNANMHTMAAHTRIGNVTGSTAVPTDVTAAQETADLNLFTTSLQGMVPASTGTTTDFLRADKIWAPLPIDTFSLRTPGTGTGAIPLAFASSGALTIPKIAPGTNITFTVAPADSLITINSTGGGGSITKTRITSGTSSTVTGGNYEIVFDFGAAISTYTLTLPASPSDMDKVKIIGGGTLTTGNEINTLFVLPNTSQSIIWGSSPTNFTTAGSIELEWDSTSTLWHQIR